MIDRYLGSIYAKFKNIVEMNCVVGDVCLFGKMIKMGEEIIIKVKVVVPLGRRKRGVNGGRSTQGLLNW